MLKRIIKCIAVIFVFSSCIGELSNNKFIDLYGSDDFSQFKNVTVFIRGTDSHNNPIVFVDAPHLVYTRSDVGCYVVILDKSNNQVIETKWMAPYPVEADTLMLQGLAQAFIKYNIPRLSVDSIGNVSIYLKTADKPDLVRFANGSASQQQYKGIMWIKMERGWSRPE